MSDGTGEAFGVQVAVEDLREKVEGVAAKVDRLGGLLEAVLAALGATPRTLSLNPTQGEPKT